jgi:predicted metal-dependent hydrolase
MSRIRYRKMDFRFDDDIPFQFNPSNIAVSDAVNALTLTAPAFEPYFIKAFRDAIPLIRDESLRAETRLFVQQERQHSQHHIAHLNMLLRKVPELEQVRDDVNASYARLYETKPLRFHLAYTATVELAFGPIARFIIETRDVLFAGGDPRISSFVLWHFVEEFEHRNCAIDVFRAVVGSDLYRLRQVPATLDHLRETSGMVRRAFAGLAAEGRIASSRESPIARTPLRDRRRLGAELVGTLAPWHRPDHLKEPAWASQWLSDAAAGEPMTLAYPAAAPSGQAT